MTKCAYADRIAYIYSPNSILMRASACPSARACVDCVLVCTHIHARACLCVCARVHMYVSDFGFSIFVVNEDPCLTRARACVKQAYPPSFPPHQSSPIHLQPAPLPPAHAPGITAPAAGARRRSLAGSNPGPSACEADVVPLRHVPGHCCI